MSNASRLFIALAVAWATAAPLLVLDPLSNTSLQVMVPLAVLAVIGLLALPGLWKGVRWVSWFVIAAVLVVVLSQVVFPSGISNELLLNGALLCLAAKLARSRRRAALPRIQSEVVSDGDPTSDRRSLAGSQESIATGCGPRRRGGLAASMAIMVACALAVAYRVEVPVPYSFEFDTFLDEQNASVTWYKLLSGSRVVLQRSPGEVGAVGLRTESIFQSAARPTKLLIGWRDLSNDHEYSAEIDLKVLILMNVSMSKLFVEPKGSHISVFLVSDDARPPKAEAIGPAEFHYKLVKQIYSR